MIPAARRTRAAAARLAVSLLWVLAAGVDAAAQAATPDAPQIGCFRGRPLPDCRSFWIVEMQGSTPLAQTERGVTWSGGQTVAREAFDHVLEWNLGHMANLTPTFALGGVVTAGTGSDGPFTGLKLRARRWLTSEVSLEVEGGLMQTNAMNTRFPAETGGTADVRLNIRDQGSFYVRWDGVTLSEQVLGPDYADPGGFQQALSVGVSAGSVPALVGSGALGLGYLVLIALFIGYVD